MMASLPQAPAQTGLASILAALGQAAPAGTATDAPGFEQLFASLPGGEAIAAPSPAAPASGAGAAALVAAPATAALPGLPIAAPSVAATEIPVLTATPAAVADSAKALPNGEAPMPPAAALFGLPQPVAGPPAPMAPVDTKAATEATVKRAVKPAPEKSPAADAAAAASLLIAVATPFKGATPAAEKPAPVALDADTPVDGETAEAASPAAAPIAQTPAPPAAAPLGAAVATVVAAAIPAAERPANDKPAKAPAPTTAPRQPEAPAATPAVKTAEPAQPLAAFPTIEPKAAKPLIDSGAAMTVLFTQPDLQGAAPLLEAAKAAPLAERTLDLTSDDQWIAQLAADIAATKSDKGDISFRLMPRHLGRLDVSMLSGDEGVTLKLDTHHEATATIVQAAQPRLVEDLRQQGVRVADAQVTHTPAETGRQQQNPGQGRGTAPDTSHLIETASDQADPTHDERTADRRGRFA